MEKLYVIMQIFVILESANDNIHKLVAFLHISTVNL